MIFKDMGKMNSAAMAFTKAIETGKYYDPDIRKRCLFELVEIFNKFNITNQDLTHMKDAAFTNARQILFICGYEMFFHTNTAKRINECIREFITT
jgi:hypothetical protein